MLGILNSLKAAPLAASTAAVTTFRCGLLRAARGYSVENVGTPSSTRPVPPPIVLDYDDDSEDEEEVHFIEEHANEDLVIKYLSEDNMSRAEVVKEELTRVRESFSVHETDTGSTAVQVATLTAKIKSLTEHMVQHRKDHSAKNGLLQMLSRRAKLLK